jgi:hypothetical protein
VYELLFGFQTVRVVLKSPVALYAVTEDEKSRNVVESNDFSDSVVPVDRVLDDIEECIVVFCSLFFTPRGWLLWLQFRENEDRGGMSVNRCQRM